MTYPPIIGLNGVARAGKDTVAGILRDLYGYQIASFSDILNETLYTLDRSVGKDAGLFVKRETPDVRYVRYADLVDEVGYEEAKGSNGVRRLLQAMGTEVGRTYFGEDVWVDALFKRIPPGQKTAIVNVRFPNEYQAVKGRGGIVWRVDRPGFEASNNHISDRALDAYSFDARIYNDGTVEELAQKVLRLTELARFANQELVNDAHNKGVRA